MTRAKSKRAVDHYSFDHQLRLALTLAESSDVDYLVARQKVTGRYETLARQVWPDTEQSDFAVVAEVTPDGRVVLR